MDAVDRWNNPRWHATYGALVAMHIQACTRNNGRLPNDDELRVIVRMSRAHADEVEEKWQEMVDMEAKV
jgi:hypothetical protein